MKQQETYLPTYAGCAVCGRPSVNSNALGLRFKTSAGGVEAVFTPGPQQQGYKNIAHGGILCAVLDETIGWAVAVDRKRFFVTAELTVRFVQPLPLGTTVIIRGRSLEHKSRYSIAEGEVVSGEGNVYARASGKFIPMPDAEARTVRDYLTYQENDLDLLG